MNLAQYIVSYVFINFLPFCKSRILLNLYSSHDSIVIEKVAVILISTISHFWSPTLTNFWWSVFASLFSMVYTPPTHKYFFCGRQNFFSRLVANWEDFKFIEDLLYWGNLISFSGDGN